MKLTNRMIGTLRSHEKSPNGILIGQKRTLNALTRRGLAEPTQHNGHPCHRITGYGKYALRYLLIAGPTPAQPTRRPTPQAQRVLDAIKPLGIPRSDYSVRTTSRIVRDPDTGDRWREWDDAICHAHGDAQQILLDNAQQLADSGLCVDVWHLPKGTKHVLVTSGHNPGNKITNICYHNGCTQHTTPAPA